MQLKVRNRFHAAGNALGIATNYASHNWRPAQHVQLILTHSHKKWHHHGIFHSACSLVSLAMLLTRLRERAFSRLPLCCRLRSHSSSGVRWAPPRREVHQPDNFAFIYLKPHANTPSAQKLVREHLSKCNVEILKDGSIDAVEIERRRVIDKHYNSIASKALDINPSDLQVQLKAQKAFQMAFGMTWSEALEKNIVFNATQAKERLGMSSQELDDKWTPLQLGEGKVKLGSGCYCGRIDDIFIINGFYMAMQLMYLKPRTSVHWFTVRWQASDLSWVTFRQELLGATEPAQATATSLRGLFFKKWSHLGLEREPFSGENAVHGSASPFEAFLERGNWLNTALDKDPFGQRLLEAGVSKELLRQWASDPVVSFQGKKQSVFDHFENLDADNCLSLASKMSQSLLHKSLSL